MRARVTAGRVAAALAIVAVVLGVGVAAGMAGQPEADSVWDSVVVVDGSTAQDGPVVLAAMDSVWD